MKKFILLIQLFLIINSCRINTQDKNESLKINVKSIEIINKVACSNLQLIRDRVVVIDTLIIQKIIANINNSIKIEQSNIKLNVQLGFFEMNYFESEIEKSYSIVYTVYDGVIIVNGDNGECFKNDELEIIVSELFM